MLIFISSFVNEIISVRRIPHFSRGGDKETKFIRLLWSDICSRTIFQLPNTLLAVCGRYVLFDWVHVCNALQVSDVQ